jgi:2-polyprenyl-3-methyl-5-hydroxy-6-metoxy-1,4-benzoquinol methylase
MTTKASTYLLDNAAAQAPARLAALADMFDATTRRHLLDRGIRPGWRCLEVGGGNGSIAKWLAERVLPDGDVLVTDLDTRHRQ